jgi:transcriptional regulator NrdR family protein
MFCIYCGSLTRVVNSRYQKRDNRVWRRRECDSCKRVFTTNETIDYEKCWTVAYPGEPKVYRKPPPLQTVENYKPIDPFSTQEGRSFKREKLYISIFNSLQHRADPIEDAIGITDTVINKLTWAGITSDGTDHEGYVALTTTAIATATHDALKRFDKAAATMYRAYHTDVL